MAVTDADAVTPASSSPETAADPVEFRSDVTVELVRSSAHDSDVLFAARVSTMGEQTLEGAQASADGAQATKGAGLINYLMRDLLSTRSRYSPACGKKSPVQPAF